MLVLIFCNFQIFLGFTILYKGFFGEGGERDYIAIGFIWLSAVYSAIVISGIPIGIPFINFKFF